jgi:hypothetical protein
MSQPSCQRLPSSPPLLESVWSSYSSVLKIECVDLPESYHSNLNCSEIKTQTEFCNKSSHVPLFFLGLDLPMISLQGNYGFSSYFH